MTRENKVALVVGFALVLFVGILISDHFSRARARPADLIPTAAEPAAPPSRHILDVRSAATPSLGPVLPAAPASGGPQAATASLATAQPPPHAATVPTVSASSAAPAAPLASAAAAASPATPLPPTGPASRVHEVRPGESLSSICQKYYRDQRLIEKLAAYNGIDDPDNLWGGVRLQVPPLEVLVPNKPAPAPPAASAKPARYQVKDGDTLCSIAQQLLQSRSRWKQLYEINREVISDPDNIRPGSVLRIPAG